VKNHLEEQGDQTNFGLWGCVVSSLPDYLLLCFV